MLRRTTLIAAVAVILLMSAGPSPADEATAAAQPTSRAITFPVEGPVSYSNDFGAPRVGHTHEGNDLMGRRGQRLLAAHDGTVSWMKSSATPSGSSGNYVMLRDSQGWEYWYIHVNNDTPGTDDGANPDEWRFAPGIEIGSEVVAGQHIAYLGDSGNAEGTAPHLHFELHLPSGTPINPYESLRAAQKGRPLPRFLLRTSPGSGTAQVDLGFGVDDDEALTCDWNGDGRDTPATHLVSRWAIKQGLDVGGPDKVFAWGRAGDQALCGDWDGDGDDTIGVRRGRDFFLRNTNGPGPADVTLAYGLPTDTPVVGDWNGDGIDTFGIRRGHSFYLRNRNTSGPANVTLAYGLPTDTPVVGDFDGDGDDSFGVRRGSKYYFRNQLSSGNAEVQFTFGSASDQPTIGDFDGDGVDTAGVFRLPPPIA